MSWVKEAKLASNLFDSDEHEKSATRDGFGIGLLKAAEESNRVVVLSADVSESTRALGFAEKYPDRYIECGVAEQNMIGVAAGLAYAGQIPVVSAYSIFGLGRTWEQIRTLVCYPNLHVIIAGSHSGLNVGPDGATHQMLEDIALASVLPNMKVYSAADSLEAEYLTREAVLNEKGPVYLRFEREKSTLIFSEKTIFNLGKAKILREGKEVSIIACGSLLYEAILATKKLEDEGIDVELINCSSIKPLDSETLIESAKKTGAIVTIEEHQKNGGLGSMIATLLSGFEPTPIEYVAVSDLFGQSGESRELREKYGLTFPYIVEAVKRVIKNKLN